jgi:dipeptide transport system permease protein
MPGRLTLFWRSFAENRGAVVGLVLMGILVIVSALADVLALHSPIEQFREHFLVPPVWQEGGDWAFPLGTDDVGRDMLSRLVHGARLSLHHRLLGGGAGAGHGHDAGADGGLRRGRDRRVHHAADGHLCWCFRRCC